MTVVAIVVVPVHIAIVEVQVISVVAVALVERTRPIVAVRALIVDTRTVAITGSGSNCLTVICTERKSLLSVICLKQPAPMKPTVWKYRLFSLPA